MQKITYYAYILVQFYYICCKAGLLEELLEISERLVNDVSLSFKRYLAPVLYEENRLIGIKGARGTGKTTMLLQYLADKGVSSSYGAYFSLDELYFTSHTLVDTVKTFHQGGGKIVLLDEVHKYPGWAREIKNIYDRYSDLKIIFTGSSIMDITKQEGDLSRRAVMYELKGLSYREYLALFHGISLPLLDLEQLISPERHKLRKQFPTDFNPLAYFKEYLQYGYYPFSYSGKESYFQRLRQLVRTIVEYDMAEMKGFDIRHAKKMLRLLYIIAQQVPFKPNVNKLALKTDIHRNTINNYLYFLHDARLIYLLHQKGQSMATLQKPEKIFMDNPNLLYALSEDTPSIGTIREVFFNNQMGANFTLNHASQTDFVVDNKYYFEIGGKHKTSKQLDGLSQAWVVKDDIEYPVANSLPLWMFGFLY